MSRTARCLRRRGVRFWTVPALARLGCRAVFFLRTGGYSSSPCRGLNLGFNSPDDPASIRRNRALALRAAGFRDLLPATGQQVHGSKIRRVSRRGAGRGWETQASAFAATDGLLTAEIGLPLAVGVADCLPVLLAAEGGGIAAVHAGWRGLSGGILPLAVSRFRTWLGVKPEQVWAAIGPAIGPEAFIIRGEVLQRLRTLFPEAVLNPRAEASKFDLWLAARLQLERAGLRPERIIVIRDSTAAHPRKYFSHRRDQGQTGRMLAMIQRQK
jgi:polyphenol oxidase